MASILILETIRFGLVYRKARRVDSNPSGNDGVKISSDSSSQVQVRDEQVRDGGESMTAKKKRKTSLVWNDFHEVELPEGGQKAVCNYCKCRFATGGNGGSTSHLRRHSQNCLQRKLDQGRHKQSTLAFQPANSSLNPFLTPGGNYSNEKMREIIATAIMVHEYPFSIVDDTIWMWGFKFANNEFEKVSQWNLQKRVLSFVKVPPPRRGVDVSDAIFKCLQLWGIESKVFSVSVDNAAYNDVCIRNLKGTLSRNNNLVLSGKLFHVRCCAHILNLLVQHGLGQIKDIIENVRESVKYVNQSDSRLKTFSDIVKQMGIKERKLVIDCPTRWNSTYEMLFITCKFKDVFPEYKEREPHYNYLPSNEDWEKVEKVCNLLEVFSLATNVISGSDYPTTNLYLPEVYRIKEVIDAAVEDIDDFIRGTAKPMKEKFDKYWGECNLLMAIASVLDPRCKFHVANICFPLIYKSENEANYNVEKVNQALEDLYDESFALSLQESSSNNEVEASMNQSSSSTRPPQVSLGSGFAKIMNMVREKQVVPPIKSELKCYLEEDVYICDEKTQLSFNVLEWWKNNSSKYRILSKMARDILAVPISTVASESTFSAGGRVIDAYRASLAENTIQALICGGDWLRNKYGLKKKQKNDHIVGEGLFGLLRIKILLHWVVENCELNMGT
ncbi:zinc finger BED domain-containing protein RICESLEEPER 1-like [Gastrolobium bilobum]|uniref:zinc finger BED domain-containing protein RICESLEEPER 1-like n=1 Tax=Gastrolobium bilobum TaxID=150636 RepID=UPI002AB0D867|nr:zinc finger BED domain-containing protein RICESLEEPER 1-like [Gastrolobium bilobum]